MPGGRTISICGRRPSSVQAGRSGVDADPLCVGRSRTACRRARLAFGEKRDRGRTGNPGAQAKGTWLLLSEVSSPGDAREAAALVLATQEFVANGGGRPSCRRRQSAASPGRTGSRGRVGRRGWCPCRSLAGRSRPARECRCFVKAALSGRASRVAQVVCMEQRIPCQTAVASWLLFQTRGRARTGCAAPGGRTGSDAAGVHGRIVTILITRKRKEPSGQVVMKAESGGARQVFGRQASFTPRPACLAWGGRHPAGRRRRLAAVRRRPVPPW